ncbi:thioredoxin family protein [Pyrococcus sp. ST04]|uniref:thioredoxin family protein n=1 Tax=Pyrococcus sp. ST04 TaxID=1183377 RepID=UPI0002605FCF|nr:thioredoxin family protein [Pyrococcus sp. ST04]AFK22710.1 putative Glutaredoxin domain-containing protein [Pyrococcus sp. ST04]
MNRVPIILLVFVLPIVISGCISSPPSTQTISQHASTTPTSHQSTTITEDWLEGLDKSKFHFYIYGLDTCPHCQRMKELLPEYFGEGSLTFYEVRKSEKNFEIYQNFSKMIGVTGVPLIGVFYSGKLYAIIEGEIDPKVIPKIVKTAMEHNSVILILSSGQYILPLNNTKAESAVTNMTKWFLMGQPEP